ncbi:MAG: DUF6174 domain-containing protein [Bacteroidia bacterium]|nr:DUF6174 domain-containing protein [Bacteroidia bacterium]
MRSSVHARPSVGRFPSVRTTLLPVILLVCLLPACEDDSVAPNPDAHFRAKQVWKLAGVHDYDFTQRRDCYCVLGGREVRLEVRGDSLRSGILMADSSALSKELLQSYCTVDSLFSYIEMARAANPASLVVEYDSLLGYPRRISVDFSVNVADDEFIYWSSDLKTR